MDIHWRKLITNKYLITSALFVVLLFFSDKNNVLDQYKLYKHYRKVKSEHDYYEREIRNANRQYKELFSNLKNLEKFAREKYIMKRDDEEVFVIVKREKESDAQKPEKVE